MSVGKGEIRGEIEKLPPGRGNVPTVATVAVTNWECVRYVGASGNPKVNLPIGGSVAREYRITGDSGSEGTRTRDPVYSLSRSVLIAWGCR
jgi:hypothetical protein